MKKSAYELSVYFVRALPAAALIAACTAHAGGTDISNTPLSNSSTASVAPNVMFILDDSASMQDTNVPSETSGGNSIVCNKKCVSQSITNITKANPAVVTYAGADGFANGDVIGITGVVGMTQVNNLSFTVANVNAAANTFQLSGVNSSGYTAYTSGGTAAACTVDTQACAEGDPPFYASSFNTIHYNPQITWLPGVNSTGASLGNASPTAAKANPYTTGTTYNLLTNGVVEFIYCNVAAPTAAQKADSAVCKRNGIHTPAAGFAYSTTINASPFGGGFPTTGFSYRVSRYSSGGTLNNNPYYFDITPREHCTDVNMQTCTASATPTGIYIVPAPARWCRTATGANSADSAAPVTGGSPAYCQAKVTGTYMYPRLGTLKRVDIVPATATYTGRFTRTDCAGVATGVCTYAEELQNYANWFQYYQKRITLMKTVAGRVFSSIDDRFRVGFTVLNQPNLYYTKIDEFTPAHKATWFTTFYSTTTISDTPTRRALSRVGRHFAGRTDGVNTVMPDDPVQYSCQQNFALLTTDGYWRADPTPSGLQIDGVTPIGNQDNADAGFSTRAAGAYDGNLPGIAGTSDPGGGTGSSHTLADVAMYYYKTDLRTSGPMSANNVPITDKDKATHQHMVTMTVSLGLDGLMTFRPDYETATTGDFAKIKNGDPAGNCSWTAGPCNWPQVKQNDPSALDDLWHAAVNSRGVQFNAKDPASLQSGLIGALTQIKLATGAASSASVSTPNITPSDNFIYSSTYRTAKWDGEVVAERIDTATGNVIPGVEWSARDQLDTRVTINSDSRTIHTLDPPDGTDKLKPFLYANLTAAEKAHFDNKCAALTQCPTLNPGQQAAVNSGSNLVNWLRGQSKKEDGVVFRDREHVLGDVVNAEPGFVGIPNLSYADAVSPDYGSFKTANASRQPVLYIAANDGMLHALNGSTGAEMWAYVPRMVMPELYKLAATDYGAAHRYYTDGSPTTMDVFLGGAWKTILVAGLNSGGRGYYALDVTVPNSPKGLWEVCSDSALCSVFDQDMGLSYSEPVITKRPSDGKWVVIVTSGYNNVTPGDGQGYIYVLDAATGAILSKVTTGAGDVFTPSGLAKVSAFATDFRVDNTTTFVYGGDLLGNVFRYNTATNTMQRIAQLFDGSSPPRPQPVTTRPEITRISGFNAVFIGTGRLLGASDLQDPATLVPAEDTAYQQTVYGIKDTGTDLGNLRLTGNLVQQTLTVIDPVTRSSSTNAVDWNTKNGWYVDLNPLNNTPGERVNIEAQLVLGTLVVVTNVPTQDACTIGGESWVYQFNYQSGQYLLTSPANAIATKLGNAVTMGIVVVRLPSGQLKAIATDATGAKTPFGVNIGASSASGKRTSWRELIH